MTCPNCGYCASCGRSYHPMPYYQPYHPFIYGNQSDLSGSFNIQNTPMLKNDDIGTNALSNMPISNGECNHG